MSGNDHQPSHLPEDAVQGSSAASRPRLRRLGTGRADNSSSEATASSSTSSAWSSSDSSNSMFALLRSAQGADEEDEPPIGHILLPGDPVGASTNHRAMEEFQRWRQDNKEYIGHLNSKRCWEIYITDRDLKVLKAARQQARDGAHSQSAP